MANGGLQTKDALMEVLQIRDVLQDRKDIRRANPNSLLTFIGNTPLIQICRMTKHLRGVQVFAKAEWLNPEGSVKVGPMIVDIVVSEISSLPFNGLLIPTKMLLVKRWVGKFDLPAS